MAPDPPPKARLTGVDAARGIAVLGMMAVHTFSETTESGAPSVTQIVAAGRSAALFAVLAGLSIAFMTGRRRVRAGPAGRAAAATLAVRAGLIGLIGMVGLGWIDQEDGIAVILPAYACPGRRSASAAEGAARVRASRVSGCSSNAADTSDGVATIGEGRRGEPDEGGEPHPSPGAGSPARRALPIVVAARRRQARLQRHTPVSDGHRAHPREPSP